MLTQLLPLSLTYTLVAVGAYSANQVAQNNQWLWLIGWLPLVFLLFLVAPYKLWRGERDKIVAIEEQARPKLALSIEFEPVSTGGMPPTDYGRFWRIKVSNVSMAPIDRCYGTIMHCLAIDDDGQRLTHPMEPWPRDAHGLPWAREQEGGYEKRFGIGEKAYLDYIMIPSLQSHLLYVPSHPGTLDNSPGYNSFPIPYKRLEFRIAVGSRAGIMSSSTITFTFEWKGRANATINEIENTSPQVLDMEGSQN